MVALRDGRQKPAGIGYIFPCAARIPTVKAYARHKCRYNTTQPYAHTVVRQTVPYTPQRYGVSCSDPQIEIDERRCITVGKHFGALPYLPQHIRGPERVAHRAIHVGEVDAQTRAYHRQLVNAVEQ